MAHYDVDKFILWLTIKQIKLYYGSPWSRSNYTMVNNKTD